MSIVKYTGRRTYNVGQALKDGFGLDWQGDSCLLGLKLVDRKNKKK